MELPEKQGLKRYNAVNFFSLYLTVAVELPEKQGLKHIIKEEIEYYYNLLQWNFQKNKD